ncbi:MAG TPA: sulfatase [Pontiellaceae bacterium]|nr:sulfatase [Pontiellaceae bacterium]
MKLKNGLLTTVGLLAATGMAQNTAAAKPNILWLLAEDISPGALSCYGQEAASTPNLDQFARDGVRYTHFYTTAPVCSPSRSAFMTGMYATTIGAHQHRTKNKKPLPDGIRPLPDWMRDAGYFTANLKTLPAPCGFRGTGKTDWNFSSDPNKAFDSSIWADLKTNQPFFAQINFEETHRDFHAARKVDPAKIKLPPYYPEHPVTRQDYAQYLDAAMELDAKVGKVLAQLEKDGLAENTIVIFMGDNGEAHVRGKQFCYEEGLHVPMIIRWPAAVAAPKQFKKGSVDDRLLEAIDMPPTFLSLVGAPIPPKMQGKAFLGDQAGAPKEYIFGARDNCDTTVMRLRTVRDARFRYIRNFTPEVPFLAPSAYKEKQYPVWNLLKELNAAGKLTPDQAVLCAPRQPEEELYDLQADPDEIHNLAKNPDYQAVLQRLRGVLEQWIIDSDDQGRFPAAVRP